MAAFKSRESLSSFVKIMRPCTNSIVICLIVGLLSAAVSAGAPQETKANDILVFSTPNTPSKASDGSDVTIYSKEGRLKKSIHVDFFPGDGSAVLGISGNAEFAFLGSGNNGGKLAVIRIAGDKLQSLGTFLGGNDISLANRGAIASGGASSKGSGLIYVSEGVGSKNCKLSEGRSIATRIVELRFTLGGNGAKSTLKRGKAFNAYSSKTCSKKDNVIIGMRTIGDRLYAVLEEKPGVYTLRSYNASSSKPQRSPSIVTYSKSPFSAITIDSPTSFVGQGLQVGAAAGFFAVQILVRIENGKAAVYGTSAPGKANSNGQRLFYGGFTSYTDGSGILASTGTLNDAGYGPVGNSMYKFNATTLGNAKKLFTLGANVMGQDAIIVPKPQ